MSEEPFNSTQSAWRDNHGNFLVGFSLILIVFGAGILAYRQSQTPPPAFPQIIDRGDQANATPADTETNTESPTPAAPSAGDSFDNGKPADESEAIEEGESVEVPDAAEASF